MNQHGILVLGHGTPSVEGTRLFLEIVKLVESMAGPTPIEAGFMEFASPTIVEGAAALQRRGVNHIAAVPVFLSGVGHTADDIPPAVDAARKALEDVQIHITRHVGSHPKVAELSALRYQEAIFARPKISADETLAVIASHGSPEPEAFLELEKFALARQKLTPECRIAACFSQLGTPLLKDVLPTLVTPNIQQIVVQPHFLLPGRLVDTIVQTTATVAKKHPEIEWLVAEPLGCHRLLAEAVLELGSDEWTVAAH